MNRPSMTHADTSNMNRSSRIIEMERIQTSSCVPASPSTLTLKKGRGSRENLRAIWQKLSSKKLLMDDSKKMPQEHRQPQRSQCIPKKGCLKVLTLEESLSSCSNASVHEEQSKCVRRRLTSLTDDIFYCGSDFDSDDDDDEDLYGEWESTPIIAKPTTISFGTINVNVFSSTPIDDAAAEEQTVMKETRTQLTRPNVHTSVDEYEMKRPSGQRKVLCKQKDEFVGLSSRKSSKHTSVIDWRKIRRSAIRQTV